MSFSGHIQGPHTSLLNGGTQHCTQHSRWGCTNAECSRITTSCDGLAILCLMHPSKRFAPWAARAPADSYWACCRPAPSDPVQHGYSPATPLPTYICAQHYHVPGAGVWHLDVLNFILLITSQCSNLSRSLCKASHPSREWTAPPRLGSSENVPMVHSTPASRSLMLGCSLRCHFCLRTW